MDAWPDPIPELSRTSRTHLHYLNNEFVWKLLERRRRLIEEQLAQAYVGASAMAG